MPPTVDRLVTERRFAAMGTRAHVMVVGGPGDLAFGAGARIDELESRWSRFRADSEVSRLNRAGGEPVAVSHDTYLLVQRACQAWHLSDGAFDPTILSSLEAAGYRDSFDAVWTEAALDHRAPAPGCAGIELDDRAVTVRLPAPVRFDPGGIGKGLAADLVAGQLMRQGARGALVSIGGDLVATGEPPDGDAWTVRVNEPTLCAEPLATVSFDGGGLATSVVSKRTWTVEGQRVHHLVDPSTGASTEGVRLATAVACEGWLAEITTKAHIAGRVSPALASVPALVLDDDGHLTARAGMDQYLDVDRGGGS